MSAKVMHVAKPDTKKTYCGVKLTGENAVLTKHAQHATCQRCIASLTKGFR